MGQSVAGIDGGKLFGNEVCLRGDMSHVVAIFSPLVDVV